MGVLLSSSPQYKNQLIENIIQLGSRTGQFSASKGKDTDVFIERKIVDADYYQADGHSEQMIERVYRAYILLDESSHEAKYNEEITQLSHEEALNPSTGEASFGISKSLFRGKTFVHKEFGKTREIKKKNAAPGKVVDLNPAMSDFLLVSACLCSDIIAYFLATLFIFLIFLVLTSSLWPSYNSFLVNT